MSPEEFQAWLDRMEWTKKTAASALKVHPNTITQYVKEGAPEMVRLACLALYHRVNAPGSTPWKP